MNIYRATLQDLDAVSALFDQYRVFYRMTSDPVSCRNFIGDRMMNKEAIVFIAKIDNNAAGFTLLYPSFSSVSMAHIFILNDLYVHIDYRHKGIGTLLLEKAVSYGRNHGALKLHLETEHSNISAQSLYEKKGWIKELNTFHFNYTL